MKIYAKPQRKSQTVAGAMKVFRWLSFVLSLFCRFWLFVRLFMWFMGARSSKQLEVSFIASCND